MSDAHAPAGHAEHSPFLAHHFDTPQQQFNAGKLGMWLFLVTEVLLFGGLFCAYAVYRSLHPEIFLYAHQFLNKNLGALNTCVLLFSSLTMAWAVHCAQCSQRGRLIVLLIITLLCGFVFMGVKYVEYNQKWKHGLLWARYYHPHVEAKPAQPASSGEAPEPEFSEQTRRQAGIFFSVYFAMTGLHGLHVVAGMTAIAWILRRSVRGDFNSQYFGPVDYVGLYWHIVDMVWIYLFPLLYLIH
jgi:cytochrome c oxidase subunit 3